MKERSIHVLLVVSCAFCALLTAACGGAAGPTGPTGPSPNDIAAQAAKGVAAASTVHLKGTLAERSTITVDAVISTSTDGDATITGSFGGVQFAMVVVDGRTYVQGAQLWPALMSDARQARAFGAKWVLIRPDDVQYGGDALATLAPALRQLASMRTADGGKLVGTFSGGRAVRVDGRRAVEVTAEGVTYDVTASAPRKVLRITSKTPLIGNSNVSNIQLDEDYDAPLSATAPGQFLDVDDQSTWPAMYDVGDDADTKDCDQYSCTLYVTTSNDGGAPEGDSVVTITAETPGGDPIESCQATITPVAHGQDTNATCTIQSDAWTSFVNGNAPEGGFARFGTSVSLHNPPYDA